jgi:hypothetical protein
MLGLAHISPHTAGGKLPVLQRYSTCHAFQGLASYARPFFFRLLFLGYEGELWVAFSPLVKRSHTGQNPHFPERAPFPLAFSAKARDENDSRRSFLHLAGEP